MERYGVESRDILVVDFSLLLSLHREGATVSTFPQAKFKVLPLNTSARGRDSTMDGVGFVPGGVPSLLIPL